MCRYFSVNGSYLSVNGRCPACWRVQGTALPVRAGKARCSGGSRVGGSGVGVRHLRLRAEPGFGEGRGFGVRACHLRTGAGLGFWLQSPRNPWAQAGFVRRPSGTPWRKRGAGFVHPGPRTQLGFGFCPSRELGFGLRPSGAEKDVWMDKRRGKVSPMDKRRGDVSTTNTPRRNQGSHPGHPGPRAQPGFGLQPSRTPERNSGSDSVHPGLRAESRVRVSAIGHPGTKPGFAFRPSRTPGQKSGAGFVHPGSQGATRVLVAAIQETRVRALSVWGRKSRLDGQTTR